MKPEPTTLYPVDDCIMEGISMCNLARDESFGWPLQDPDLDSDPFNLPVTHGLDFAFDPMMEASRDWAHSCTPVPESAWQQLALKLNSPSHQPQTTGNSSTLTPCLAALELPQGHLPEELDYAAIGSRRPDFLDNREERAHTIGTYLRDRGYQCTSEQEHLPCPGDLITIGSYTQSQRALKLLHYRQKRARRNFAKRVLYDCRKEFADSRPRVGGRFVIDENRVIKPKTFLKRGRPRKTALPLINYLATGLIST